MSTEKSPGEESGSHQENGPLSLPAHCLTADAAVRDLSTHADDGLSWDEAEKRLQSYGPNMLEEGEGVSVVKILIRQVANAMMLVKRPIPLSPCFPLFA